MWSTHPVHTHKQPLTFHTPFAPPWILYTHSSHTYAHTFPASLAISAVAGCPVPVAGRVLILRHKAACHAEVLSWHATRTILTGKMPHVRSICLRPSEVSEWAASDHQDLWGWPHTEEWVAGGCGLTCASHRCDLLLSGRSLSLLKLREEDSLTFDLVGGLYSVFQEGVVFSSLRQPVAQVSGSWVFGTESEQPLVSYSLVSNKRLLVSSCC